MLNPCRDKNARHVQLAALVMGRGRIAFYVTPELSHD